MNYDDIILECNTPCEECPTYLECQYQTSSGAEKKAWLEKLIERDKKVEEPVVETIAAAEEPVVAEPVVEEAVAVEEPTAEPAVTETPAIAEAPAVAETAFEATHESGLAITLTSDQIHQIYLAVFGENYDLACTLKAEAHQEVSAESVPAEAKVLDAPTHQASGAIALTSEQIHQIYLAVFGENYDLSCTLKTEAVQEVKAQAPTQQSAPCEAPTAEKDEDAEEVAEAAEQKPQKETFKLTPPPQNEELLLNMCAKRGRKLIYRPNEVIYSATFKVLGTDKKNDVGEKVKDIIDAEIKQGLKLGYLDKFDGLKSSEIKEEYEDDIVYEFADQEFKKTGVIYDGQKVKVYLYDWDLKACHHVGFVDGAETQELLPYLNERDKYSFDVCGIITGGKAKRVVKEGSALKIIKEKGDPIGLDVDIAVIPRKD